MRIWRSPCGDEAHRYNKSVVLTFAGPRRVLSTSPFNGGLRRDLKQVFNHCCNPGEGMACLMRAPTYEEHLSLVAKDLGLDPQCCAGLSTAASMDMMAIKTECWGSVDVTAFATAGVEVNGGRVGDPALWDEECSLAAHPAGTINILLHVGCDLSEGALTRGLITCTEAKTAALQELMASSRYSRGLATGSGTDGAVLVAVSGAPVRLTDTGNHSKLGETIGRTVMDAVKEALRLQTGLCPEMQHDLLRRMDRFGVTEDALWARYRDRSGMLDRPHFSDVLHGLSRRGEFVALLSLCAHLMDQTLWGLLSPPEAWKAALAPLAAIGFGVGRRPVPADAETFVSTLIDVCCEGLLNRVEQEQNGHCSEVPRQEFSIRRAQKKPEEAARCISEG